jgi:hypothetical protein
VTPSGLVCLAADKPEGGHALDESINDSPGPSTTDHLVRRPTHELVRGQLAITALAQDLLAWCARLALPTTVAGYEPKRLRLRILATAGRLVRTARRRVLHVDSSWPWAETITTAHARLRALPVP